MIILTALGGMFANGWATGAPQTVARAAQVADARFEPSVPSRAWKNIVVHHSATSGGSVESIDAVHRTYRDSAGRPWRGIGYHFVVGNGRSMTDGQIEPTFRWRDQLAGAHAGSQAYNESGIGICLIGNFDEHTPTARQLATLQELCETLIRRYAIPADRVVRHGDIHNTRCPGKLFPWDEAVAKLTPASKGS